MNNTDLDKLLLYLEIWKTKSFYKGPETLFLELIILVYRNRFWCAKLYDPTTQDDKHTKQFSIFLANQKIISGWYLLKTEGLLLNNKRYRLDLSKKDDLLKFFMLINHDKHNPENEQRVDTKAIERLHVSLFSLFHMFKAIEKQLGPQIPLVDWDRNPVTVNPEDPERVCFAWQTPEWKKEFVSPNSSSYTEHYYAIPENYQAGLVEDRNLYKWEEKLYAEDIWTYSSPQSKEWQKVDPLFQELRSNHYYKDIGWSEKDSCYLEGEKQTSKEISNSLSVNGANNSNLCKNFDAFEEEILPGGFSRVNLQKFAWLFEESLDFSLSWLFWLIKIFLIMQRNFMFIFAKIKIKYFFLYCKKKFK